jgi:hypothetical protein
VTATSLFRRLSFSCQHARRLDPLSSTWRAIVRAATAKRCCRPCRRHPFPPTTLSDSHSTLPLSTKPFTTRLRQQHTLTIVNRHTRVVTVKFLGSTDSGTIPYWLQPSRTEHHHHHALVKLEIGVHSRHSRQQCKPNPPE